MFISFSDSVVGSLDNRFFESIGNNNQSDYSRYQMLIKESFSADYAFPDKSCIQKQIAEKQAQQAGERRMQVIWSQQPKSWRTRISNWKGLPTLININTMLWQMF